MKFLKKKYGSNSVKKPEEVSGNEEKTNSNEKKPNSQAGNLKADKVQLVTEEFDTLFGVEDRVREDAPRSAGEDDDMKADAVPSAGLVQLSRPLQNSVASRRDPFRNPVLCTTREEIGC